MCKQFLAAQPGDTARLPGGWQGAARQLPGAAL